MVCLSMVSLYTVLVLTNINMKSVAVVFVGLFAVSFAAPSGLIGVGIGHGVPLATSALVAGPSGVISSHQSNGAIAVAAPAVVAAPTVLAAAPVVAGPAVVSLAGHGLGLGLAGHGLGLGLGGLGLGLGHGVHGW